LRTWVGGMGYESWGEMAVIVMEVGRSVGWMVMR
jgi:hypothetical protein